MLSQIGAPELTVLFAVGFAVWFGFLLDAVWRPQAEWQAAGQNKILVLALMVILGLIGTLLYATIARPALKRSAVAAG